MPAAVEKPQDGKLRRHREKSGKPDLIRAVAGACAANKIATVLPCHRGAGLTLRHRWGVERKRALLRREAAG